MEQRELWRVRTRDGFIVGAVVAALVLLLWWANWFVSLRLSLSDFFYLPMETSDTLVLVAIDDNTLSEYGSLLRWDRTRYADALDTLVDAEARVVAFDVLFSEPAEGDEAFAASLRAADTAGTRTVLAVSGVDRFRSDGKGVAFARELRPVPILADAAGHLAYVNAIPDADGTVRRALSFGVHGDTERLSFPLATYLSYYRISPALVDSVVNRDGETLSLPPERVIPLEDDGLWLQNYFGNTALDGTFQVVSFLDLAEGRVSPETFTDKIVIVGLMNVVGAVDRYPAPPSRASVLMPGMEIQAHAVETLLMGVPLRLDAPTAGIVAFIGLALITALACAYSPRWYGMIAIGLAVLLAWTIYASFRFSAGMVVTPLHPPLAVILAMIGSVGMRVSREVWERQRAETLLASLTAVSEQRLALDRIVSLLVDDLKRLTGAPDGGIWMLNSSEHFEIWATWGNGEALSDVAETVFRSGTHYEGDGVLAVPVAWGGRTLGVFAVGNPPRLGRARASLLRFAGRIGTNIDNALLFGKTEQQNQLLTSVLAESPAGILVLDQSLNLLRCNAAAAGWLTLDITAVVGQPISFVLEGSPLDQAAWEQIGEALMQGEDFRQEITLNGRTYRLDAVHIPQDGRWVMTLGDISDLVELSRLKTQMIRMASHDLKNPLGRILGYGEMMQEMMQDDESNAQYIRFTDRMVKSANEMLGIISEILDLEHIRSGKIVHESLDMSLVVRDVIERYRDDMAERQQTFYEDISPDLPPIKGDYNQLVQSVSNLLSNASKYTPDDGQVTLRLFANGDMLRLEVQDTGYGMPKEAQDKLFTEFYRVRTEQTKDIKGTGLGLSLVKSVIEAHNGRIWVESELDKGSTFYVELPLTSAVVAG